MRKLVFKVSLLCILLNENHALFAQDSKKYFTITVVDQKTGRGVPLVELKTSSQRRFYTDSNGIIAFEEPSLMNQKVYFSVFSHGYECAKDALGNRSVLLKTTPGDSTLLKIYRINIAERLYRITGQDIYGESSRVGHPIPIKHPRLNGKVMGQDTFIETLYNGKLYWFWGDTKGPANFNGKASGATSDLPGKGGLDPGVGIDLTYFVDSNGFSKPMCNIPAPGLVWIDWLITLPDEKGQERLYAKYSRTKTLDLDYERGIALFNDSTQLFERVVQVDEWLDKVHSSGHPLHVRIDGVEYFYIIDGYGLERVQADIKPITNAKSYEHFTCYASGTRYKDTTPKIDRDSSGKAVYIWKANTGALSPEQQGKLITAGTITSGEGLWQTRDVESGKPILAHPASVLWNNFCKRWVMLAYESIGQIWYFEGDTPTGPWVYGRKVVTHDHYDFYNVGQHPLFDQQGGRLIYFEGTYTTGFSGNKFETPLYDYNQMMYCLSLDDKRLSLPAPVYRIKDDRGNERYLMRETVDSLNLWERIQDVPFFAIPPSRGSDEFVPVYVRQAEGGVVLTTSPTSTLVLQPLFYGIPAAETPLSQRDLITGPWKCRATMPDGSGEEFELELVKEGEKVTGTGVTKGIFRNGKLMLTLQIMDYALTATLNNGTLKGEFRKDDGTEKGVWSGERTETLQKEKKASPSVAFLYEYPKTDNSKWFYSVDSTLATGAIARTAQPICKVWLNPSSVLALDYKVKPVQLVR